MAGGGGTTRQTAAAVDDAADAASSPRDGAGSDSAVEDRTSPSSLDALGSDGPERAVHARLAHRPEGHRVHGDRQHARLHGARLFPPVGAYGRVGSGAGVGRRSHRETERAGKSCCFILFRFTQHPFIPVVSVFAKNLEFQLFLGGI